jgi:geranylgeranyl transferase type-2 subunit beta
MYWCVSALDICNSLGGQDLKRVVEIIEGAKNEDGGYACAAGNDSHLLQTLCAIQVLKIIDRMDLIDVDSVVKYVQSLQNEDGSFSGDMLRKSFSIITPT